MITILTASWGNETRTCAIVNTTEVGHKAISKRDTPQAWADFVKWRKAGGKVRRLQDGGAYKADKQREATRAALKASAEAKLASLGITPEELRAMLEVP